MTSATTSTKESPILTAAATASLTGQLALQGRQAALGLEWWAAEAGVALEISDDVGIRALRDRAGGSGSLARGWHAPRRRGGSSIKAQEQGGLDLTPTTRLMVATVLPRRS